MNFAIQVSCLLLLISCTSPSSQPGPDTDYLGEIQEWHKKRIERLKSEDGWLNLAGLYWLRAGENTFGSHQSNHLVFPEDRAPGFIGTLLLENGTVRVRIKPGIVVTHGGIPVTNMTIYQGDDNDSKVLTHGSLRWFVIKRDDRFAVRLRDLESPHVANFKGIETYPIDASWRIEAELRPYHPAKIIQIPTVLGTVRKQPSPGALVFKVEDKTYSLDSVSEHGEGRLFVIFSDLTTGVDTYGGGRFLYVDKPPEGSKTFIDFNKAYNPPCAFSAYSTCPLPPQQNHLPLAVTAGEKRYEH